MEEGSKRRLIGATVVVVLLVTFVPMVLEEDPKPPVPPPASDVASRDQARPEMDAEFRQPAKQSPLATITELPPPDLLTSSERDIAGQGSASRVDMPVTKPPKGPEAQKPKEAAKPAAKEAPKETKKEVAKDIPKETKKEITKVAPKDVPKEPAKEKEAAKPADPGPKKTGAGWVFQVASLSERAKADEMAGNLKAKGFPAFVEAAEVNGKTYFRVRVGPRQERKDIDALAASVRDKTGQSGQVQRY
ncbi:MAG: SPOR domain-containing protein [Chromatiaceae bacterium]|nr:SPOR domain-containing protein [Chromatiaceae bacterium]